MHYQHYQRGAAYDEQQEQQDDPRRQSIADQGYYRCYAEDIKYESVHHRLVFLFHEQPFLASLPAEGARPLFLPPQSITCWQESKGASPLMMVNSIWVNISL
jgi:hypothetical protein